MWGGHPEIAVESVAVKIILIGQVPAAVLRRLGLIAHLAVDGRRIGRGIDRQVAAEKAGGKPEQALERGHK